MSERLRRSSGPPVELRRREEEEEEEEEEEVLVVGGTYDGGIVGLSLKPRAAKAGKTETGKAETGEDQSKGVRGIFETVFAFKAHLASVKDVDSRGSLLVTASTDETTRIYNLKTKCDSGMLAKHEGSVTCVRLSQNSKYLISCGEDKAIHIWRCANWDLVKSFEGIHDSTPVSADFHPSMRLALTLDIEGNLCMLDLLKGVLAVKFSAPGLGKRDSSFNRRFGLFTTVRFNTTGSHYAALSQRELVVACLESDQDWFLSSSTADLGLGPAQITSFFWITDLAFLVGFSNGQLRMLQVTPERRLDCPEMSFVLPGQTSAKAENPHLGNRIKGICAVGRVRVRNQAAEDLRGSTPGKLVVTCDSSGIFVLFNLVLTDDPETGKARCELQILDMLDSDNRITCMTVESKATTEDQPSSWTSPSNSDVLEDQSRLSSVPAKGNKKPKVAKKGKPAGSKARKDNPRH